VSILHTTLRSLTIAVAAVALTGCISLFPKSKPAGLYRFGHVGQLDPCQAILTNAAHHLGPEA